MKARNCKRLCSVLCAICVSIGLLPGGMIVSADAVTVRSVLGYSLETNDAVVPVGNPGLEIAYETAQNSEALSSAVSLESYEPGNTVKFTNEAASGYQGVKFDLKQNLTPENTVLTFQIKMKPSVPLSTNPKNAFYMQLTTGGAHIRMDMRMYDNKLTVARNSGTGPDSKEITNFAWHDFVFTVNMASKTYSATIDGVVWFTGADFTNTTLAPTGSTSAFSIADPGTPSYIGRHFEVGYLKTYVNDFQNVYEQDFHALSPSSDTAALNAQGVSTTHPSLIEGNVLEIKSDGKYETAIPYTGSLSDDSMTYTVIPDAPLTEGAQYRLCIAGDTKTVVPFTARALLEVDGMPSVTGLTNNNGVSVFENRYVNMSALPWKISFAGDINASTLENGVTVEKLEKSNVVTFATPRKATAGSVSTSFYMKDYKINPSDTKLGYEMRVKADEMCAGGPVLYLNLDRVGAGQSDKDMSGTLSRINLMKNGNTGIWFKRQARMGDDGSGAADFGEWVMVKTEIDLVPDAGRENKYISRTWVNGIPIDNSEMYGVNFDTDTDTPIRFRIATYAYNADEGHTDVYAVDYAKFYAVDNSGTRVIDETDFDTAAELTADGRTMETNGGGTWGVNEQLISRTLCSVLGEYREGVYTVMPREGLEYLQTYLVTVTDQVKTNDGTAVINPFSAEYTGIWHEELFAVDSGVERSGGTASGWVKITNTGDAPQSAMLITTVMTDDILKGIDVTEITDIPIGANSALFSSDGSVAAADGDRIAVYLWTGTDTLLPIAPPSYAAQ